MKVKSEFVLELEKELKSNVKYDFGKITVGNFSIMVTKNGDIFTKIVRLLFPNQWKQIIHTGNRAIVIDSDVYLNRKFLGIFGDIPNCSNAKMGIKLTTV